MNKPHFVKTGCKINLGLNITERRPDGYHNLQTIFYPVPLFDELTIRPLPGASCSESEGEDTLTLGGHPLEGDVQDNLVLRAFRKGSRSRLCTLTFARSSRAEPDLAAAAATQPASSGK